jgi:hypothetical protein
MSENNHVNTSVDQTKKRVNQMIKVHTDTLEVFERKNKDYGDAFAKHGIVGLMIRMEDKMQRFISVSNNGINLVKDETLRDTLMDLHNYAAMAVMLLDEQHEENNKLI